ncbi:hypothetical protein [Desulfosediminicola ganghwensis]|uniref:hypothetical protein n=1 Tax=Desulfosediminicola ganghwensis TaxID=2569540 RepID=UPI0010AB623C|nr:hypothetical protein [Desulfosediminicola ganghwensis]
MLYKIIAFFIFSGIASIKKPIYGGLAGMVTAPVIYVIFNSYDLPTVGLLSAFGFGFGLIWGVLIWNFIHGKEYNEQNKKTYVMPIGKPGSSQRGGIIYTDEEEKNAKDNEKNNI